MDDHADRPHRPHARPPRVDGARHRHPDDPARARWYALRRCARFALYLRALGGPDRTPAT